MSKISGLKILFVAEIYPQESIEDFRRWSKGDMQTSADVFQWAVLRGLVENQADVEVISLPGMPSFSSRCSKLFIPGRVLQWQGRKVGSTLTYCNFPAYKMISMYFVLKRFILSWLKRNRNCGKQIVILTYNPYSSFIRAVISSKKKYPDIRIASIVTDLVDDMLNFHNNRTFLKRLQCHIETMLVRRSYKDIDKFILLSPYMTERIPEAVDNYIVLEGIYSERTYKPSVKMQTPRSLLYTGALDDYSGVSELLDAFRMIDREDCRLVICGDGPLKERIREFAANDSRIIYKGRLPHEDILQLQQEATLLINPRRPDATITRFSFPSKTIEYLASGTPMIGYVLDGIPAEYYEYIYVVEGMSVKSLADTIERVLFLPQDTLDKKSLSAQNFIRKSKSASYQVARMLNYMQSERS